MGQTIGRAPLLPAPKHFVNLPKACIYELWEAFNDIAEGFGMTSDEFLEILRVCLKDYLEYSEKKLDNIAKAVFIIFDDDQNDLVDALEFLAAFAVISGMTPEEKTRYVFGIFDFDESGLLSVDEMILALRTTISGLTKLSAVDSPLESDIEHIAIQAFGDLKTIDGSMVTREKFLEFCATTPELVSWLEYFGDIDEFGVEVLNPSDKMAAELVTHGARVLKRSTDEFAAMDTDSGQMSKVAIEAKGLAINIKPSAPWQNTVTFTEPSVIPKKIPATAPDVHLDLEWIHGFNAKQSRQNIDYSHKGEIIYPAGAVGVVLDVASKRQIFMNAHTDIILCMKVLAMPKKKQTLVVSGEAGKLAKVIVWNTGVLGKAPEVLKVLKGFHQDGVSHVGWAPDGEVIITVGSSGMHCVALYEWRSGAMLFSAQATEQPVLDTCWTRQDQFVTCGTNHMHIWTKTGKAYRRQRGLFGKKASAQALLCTKAFGEVVVSGAASGHLYVWEGRNCIRAVKAHSGAITALHVIGKMDDGSGEVSNSGPSAGGFDKPGGLCTGSTDGKIQLWSAELEVGACFDLASLGGVSKAVQSVNWDFANHKILIGSWSSEVFEMNDIEGFDINDGPVVQGHFEHRLFGLSVNPANGTEYVTVGEDKTVRIWDTETHTLKTMSVLDTMAHCVSWSPDGELIAVGLGYRPGGFGPGAKRQRKDGAFLILQRSDLTIVQEARDSKQLISSIKWSPDGGTLAVTSYDRAIYLYNVGDWASTAKCRGHKGRITGLDWSTDANFLQSTDDLGELIFWEAESGEQRTARTMRDIEWETQTCVYGWPLKSAWGQYDDNCALAAAYRAHGGTTIATVDQFSRLRVWRYPCVAEEPNWVEVRGHGGPCSNVTFTVDDSFVITTGREDCCVFQWRYRMEGKPTDEATTEEEPVGSQIFDYIDHDKFVRPEAVEAANVDDRSKIFIMEERAAEEDFTPVRPWQRSVVAPSRPPPERLDEPVDGLRLEWVYGFRAQDVRGGVDYTHTGEVMFFAGATNVILDTRARQQRFHCEHTDEVTCLAKHPSRTLVATGQQGAVPSILIWDYEAAPDGGNLPTVRSITGVHRRAVSCMAFDESGKFLVSVGTDTYHTVAVLDWENQTVRCSATSCSEKTLCVGFTHDGTGVVQCGVNFMRFWSISGRNMTYQSGVLGTIGQWQPFLCMGHVGNRTVVGTQDGHLYVMAGRQLDRTVPAHTGPVNWISSTNEGICTGGHDGLVKIWTTTLEVRLVIDMAHHDSIAPTVRSVTWDNETNRILVGTLGAEIFELNGSDGANVHGSGPVNQGHSHAAAELHALSAHPTQPLYATAGDDATLRVWDAGAHKIHAMTTLEMPCRCIAYSPTGDRIAVGYGSPIKVSSKQFDGKWVILNAETFDIMHEAKDSQKYLTECKWTPNGSLVAFGSWDCKIYLYDCENGYQLSAVATQHNSYIRSFDFSANSQYMMSNCGAFELCLFEADTAMFLPAASRLKDCRWATCTSAMSWATQGLWPAQNDSTDITTVDANLVNNPGGNIVVAAGDSFGRVRLARYPCDSALAQCKLYRGHGGASQISKVRWVCGDSYLVTMSAKERTIFQWAHDADDLAAMDDKEAVPFDLDEDVRAAAMGEEATTALAEVKDPLGADLALGDASADVNTKPWLSAIVEPSDAPRAEPAAPDLSVRLERVFGVQVSSAREAIAYNVLGEVIWPSACTCVVYSKQTHSQRFFLNHTAEVTCVAVSPDGRLVASGEKGARPVVRIWDAQTCVELKVLGPFHRQGIACVAWSEDSKTVAMVGRDIEHSVSVWSSATGGWDDARRVAYAPGNHEAVYFITFLDDRFWGPAAQPQSSSGQGATPAHPGFLFATGGVDHVKFWSMEGRTLTASRALWGSVGRVQPMLCGCATGPRLVTGSVSGHLYVWRGRRCEKIIRAHESNVTSLYATETGVVSGGGDGFVKLYSSSLEHLRSYGLHEAQVPPLRPGVKAVCAGLDKDGVNITKIVVATESAEVYELAKDSGNWTLLGEGHYSQPQDGAGGELWGLAPHPTNPDIFATAGDDATVRIWSISQGRLLRKAQLDCATRCVTWNPSGTRLLVGLGGSCRGVRQKKDGAFMMLHSETLEVLYEGRDARHWLREVKYSPDGQSFACASQDQKIYLYDNRQNIMRAKCDKHNSYVTSLDFSDDGAYVQSDAGDFEHLYHSATDGQYFKLPSQLKNVRWFSWSCIYGWPVQGIWPTINVERDPNDPLPPDPTSAHRSFNQDLVAVGYQDGQGRIFRYPCITKAAQSIPLTGHVADMPSVRFMCDDTHLITVGKADRAICVWKIIR